jgi:hypothetical protein
MIKLVDIISPKNIIHTGVIVLFALGFLILPSPVFVLVLLLYCIVDNKFDSPFLAFLVIFYFSFLISSRFSGGVWSGSDDMPSYFLAYDAMTSGKDALWSAQKYTKHLDYLFIVHTKVINYFSDGHRFVYYFSTVFLSFTIFYGFSRRVLSSGGALLALLLFLTYFKNIHLSMHLLRSSLAISMILYAMTFDGFKRYSLYAASFFTQGSTFLLMLPVLLLKNRLFYSSFDAALNIKILMPLLLIPLAVAYFIMPDFYVFNKLRFIEYNFGFGNYYIILANVIFVFLLFSISIGRSWSYSYKWTGWMNVYIVFVLISLFGLIFNHHAYRFGQQVLYLSPILVVIFLHGFERDIYLKTMIVIIYSVLSYCTYFYVIDLNESSFYYLSKDSIFVNGIDQINSFRLYLEHDVSYDDSWRAIDK